MTTKLHSRARQLIKDLTIEPHIQLDLESSDGSYYPSDMTPISSITIDLVPTVNIGNSSHMANCKLCDKPFDVDKSEVSWKKLCIYCHMKIYGKVVECSACSTKFLTYQEKEEGTFCYGCSLGVNGGHRIHCQMCKRGFYVNSVEKHYKTHCYECYLKTNGEKINCVTCRKELYVKRENLNWKKKCFDCYVNNN